MYRLTEISTDDSWGYSDEETGKTVKPDCVDLTQRNLCAEDLYLVDSGDLLYLWVGQNLD